MSETFPSFMDQALDGRAALDQIDDFVDRWHQNPLGRELPSYLGMTASEYALWVEHPEKLANIVRARRELVRSA